MLSIKEYIQLYASILEILFYTICRAYQPQTKCELVGGFELGYLGSIAVPCKHDIRCSLGDVAAQHSSPEKRWSNCVAINKEYIQLYASILEILFYTICRAYQPQTKCELVGDFEWGYLGSIVVPCKHDIRCSLGDVAAQHSRHRECREFSDIPKILLPLWQIEKIWQEREINYHLLRDLR